MRYFVKEIEHDSWSGPSTLSIKEYDDELSAKLAARNVNAQNTSPTVPDYYITAEVVNDISISEYDKYVLGKC